MVTPNRPLATCLMALRRRIGWPSGQYLAAFLLSLPLAFMLGFFLEISLGLIGFWTLEVSSLLFVYMMFNFFLSGHMFPLDFLTARLPEWAQVVMHYQPLQYLAYFPAAVFLGKIEGEQLVHGLFAQAMWVGVFIILCRVALERGYRRYSGWDGARIGYPWGWRPGW